LIGLIQVVLAMINAVGTNIDWSNTSCPCYDQCGRYKY
jgi:hypothetical protein